MSAFITGTCVWRILININFINISLFIIRNILYSIVIISNKNKLSCMLRRISLCINKLCNTSAYS